MAQYKHDRTLSNDIKTVANNLPFEQDYHTFSGPDSVSQNNITNDGEGNMLSVSMKEE